jgi:hypothetical protein
LQFSGEFLDHRRFASAANREIANGDNLNPQGGVSQNSPIIKESPGFDRNREQFREAKEKSAHQGSPFALSFIENDLQNKRFQLFSPCAKLLSQHPGIVPTSSIKGKGGNGWPFWFPLTQ